MFGAARYLTALLDGIPGAFEAAQHGSREGREGRSVPLDQI